LDNTGLSVHERRDFRFYSHNIFTLTRQLEMAAFPHSPRFLPDGQPVLETGGIDSARMFAATGSAELSLPTARFVRG